MHEVITLLNEVADGMPPARLPEDLWRRGRRRRRLRRLGALAAVAALMAGAAFGPAWLLHRPTALTGGPSGTPIVPSFVYPPWLWQATVGQWPPGPAAVLFFTNRTRYLEETGVVIGRNGADRLVPMTVGEERGLLSPDGRSVRAAGPNRSIWSPATPPGRRGRMEDPSDGLVAGRAVAVRRPQQRRRSYRVRRWRTDRQPTEPAGDLLAVDASTGRAGSSPPAGTTGTTGPAGPRTAPRSRSPVRRRKRTTQRADGAGR